MSPTTIYFRNRDRKKVMLFIMKIYSVQLRTVCFWQNGEKQFSIGITVKTNQVSNLFTYASVCDYIG